MTFFFVCLWFMRRESHYVLPNASTNMGIRTACPAATAQSTGEIALALLLRLAARTSSSCICMSSPQHQRTYACKGKRSEVAAQHSRIRLCRGLPHSNADRGGDWHVIGRRAFAVVHTVMCGFADDPIKRVLRHSPSTHRSHHTHRFQDSLDPTKSTQD